MDARNIKKKKKTNTTGFARWLHANFICSQTYSKFRETPPSLSLQHTTCLPSLPDPTSDLSDLPRPQPLPPWHEAAQGRTIKWYWIEPSSAGHRLCLALPRGLCPCRNLLLQQQIANGPAVRRQRRYWLSHRKAALQPFPQVSAERRQVPFSSHVSRHRGNHSLGAPSSANLGALNVQ